MDISNSSNIWNEKLIAPEKDSKFLLSELCRLCGIASRNLISIYEGEGLENDLGGKIEKHLPVRLLENNHLPQRLCYHCANTVIAWHDITENILKVDDKFRTILEEMGYSKKESCINASEIVHLPAFEFDGNEKQTSFNNSVTEEINVPSRIEITRSQEQESESFSLNKAEGKLISASFTLFEHQEGNEIEFACVEDDEIFNPPIVSCNPSTAETQTKYYSVDETPNDSACFPYAVESTQSSVFYGSQTQRNEEVHDALPIKNDILCVLAENSCDTSDLQKLDHDYILQDSSLETEDQNDSMCDSKTTEMSAIAHIVPSENWIKPLPYKLKMMKRRGNANLVRWLWTKRNGVVQCKICSSSFQNVSVLLTHLRFHSKQTPFYCKFCGRNFYLYGSLKQHLERCLVREKKDITCISSNSLKESKNRFTCGVCGKTFKLKASLKDHFMHHVGKARPKFKCEKCGAKFLRKAEILEHVKTHNDSVLTCETCNKIVLNEKDLEYHKISHSNLRPYQCNICNVSYKRKSHLTRHLKAHVRNSKKMHSSQTRQGGSQEHKCELCDKICCTMTLLALHRASHTGERKHECRFCGRRFGQSGGLSRHIHTIHSGAKDFVCVVCNCRFTAKATLDSHLRIHTGEKPYQCVQCGKTFRTQQQHKLHEKTHSDVRPFPCPYCSKRFRRRPHLVVHIRTHTGEKPYSCTVCGRGFSQKNDMLKHMIIHENTCYN